MALISNSKKSYMFVLLFASALLHFKIESALC